MKFRFLSLLTMVLFAATSMPANDKAYKGACKADIEKFCQNVEKGEGRIVKCLKENEASLSESCQSKRSEMKEKHKEFAKACKEDRKKLCADIKPGKGAIVQCLKAKEAEVSAGCADFLKNKE
ncbi:MAG: cysteine rich repeat-containing protein [Leptospira sp.]|jgi:hypothetical protein|nr:cysteine rich repeat-containing protein [Leptospira sp.]